MTKRCYFSVIISCAASVILTAFCDVFCKIDVNDVDSLMRSSLRSAACCSFISVAE